MGNGDTTTTVRETERKYESAQPPGPELIGALAAAVGGAAPTAPTRADLSATYYDTADLRLLRSRITLRRRRGGHDAGWHLKLPAGTDSRDEVRQPLGRHRKPPAPLVALSRAAHRDAPLQPVVELDTVREEWTLTDDRGEPVATVTDDRVTARHLDTGVERGTVVDTEPLEWAEIEVELAGNGTPEVLDRIEEALRAAGVQRSASASKLGRVLAGRVPPAPPRPVAGREATAGEVVLVCTLGLSILSATRDLAVALQSYCAGARFGIAEAVDESAVGQDHRDAVMRLRSREVLRLRHAAAFEGVWVERGDLS